MQFSTLTVAFFAAGLATAHHPAHFHNRRQLDNGTGSLTTLAAPLGTGVTSGGSSPTNAASGSDSVVLTYTLGSGSTTTVVTTTIRHTSVHTVTSTLPGGAVAGVTKDAAASAELTTTSTDTSTSTKYITVMAVSSGLGGADSGASACAPVTVTVALSTVTVTALPSPASDADGSVAAETAPAGSVAAESIPSGAVVIQSTATVSPLPVQTSAPYGNGTNSAPTTVAGPSSGLKARATARAAKMFYE